MWFSFGNNTTINKSANFLNKFLLSTIQFFFVILTMRQERVFSITKNKTKSTFIDILINRKTRIFFKMGANLDSIIKVLVIDLFTNCMSTTLLVFDKFNINYLAKKTIEYLFDSFSGIFGKKRREFISIFSIFWKLVPVLFLFFICL